MTAVVLESTLTCPECGHAKLETMAAIASVASMRFIVTPLLQIGQRGAEVDVERLAVDHQRRHRLHAQTLSLGDTAFLLAQMHDFDDIARRVDGLDELLLG